VTILRSERLGRTTPPRDEAWLGLEATELAARVNARQISASAVARAVLGRIAAADASFGACTSVFTDAALAEAERIDAAVAAGRSAGPLAGVPVVVKNLFDVRGEVTLAGARRRMHSPPAGDDATVVGRLRAAGALVVAATNMDEYAYGFTTENRHFGTTRNPRDPARLAGGSSGGSAAAVAAGFAHVGLGSDTNGSVRVPAAYCGVFGLKPTFGRLSRRGLFPFVASLDHVGHLARSVRDLALAYDVMQGPDPADDACAQRPVEPTTPALRGDRPWRVGVLEGWFRRGADDDTLAAIDRVASDFTHVERVELPGADVARAAAYVLTAAEGATLHADGLRRDPLSFDPACRDRLLAGLMTPAIFIDQAQRFRRTFATTVAEAFRRFDVLLAPATPTPALAVGQSTFDLAGEAVPARAHIGVYTQPLSFVGLPIVVAPLPRPGRLPIGLQVVAPLWQESEALAFAASLERRGLAASPVVL
jgi:AtzE family amidohydrolase